MVTRVWGKLFRLARKQISSAKIGAAVAAGGVRSLPRTYGDIMKN